MNEVWMVEWTGDYCDCNAAFSTRDKAIGYIEDEAKRMELENFEAVDVDIEAHPEWGCYEFTDEYPDAGGGSVTFQCYPID